MSYDAALSRISEISRQLPAAAAAPVPAAVLSRPATMSVFARQLDDRMGGQVRASAAGAAPMAGAGADTGSRMLVAAQAEVARGVAEQPPGSNDSPDIARFRTATQGAMPGAPWCAYFVSYLAKQAGAPLGDHGQGFGLVDDITAWSKRTGRFIPTGGPVKPGDVALFDEHVGIVETVKPDGRLTLIEGNSSDRVRRTDRSVSELVGFARI